MKNETIKTYTEITVEQAGEMLRDNGWKPVELAFGDEREVGLLTGIDVSGYSNKEFKLRGVLYSECFTVTEIDPCVAPDGCPELEPWMAFIGNEVFPTPCDAYLTASVYVATHTTGWENHVGAATELPKAIDVRTAWSQGHFPEHCRIRNYQETDPFEEWIDARFYKDLSLASCYTCSGQMLIDIYELGQSNPTK